MDTLRSDSIEATKIDKFNYYGDFVLLPCFLIADLYYLTEYFSLNRYVLLFFILGLLVYGAFIEYGFHRFIYHGSMKKIKKLHLIHHKFPKSYVSSPPYVTAIIMGVFYLVFMGLFGRQLGCAFVGGITFGYLWYIYIHHLIHHLEHTNSTLLNHFKIEHQSHHDHARLNYCVSQPFWNTLYRKCNAFFLAHYKG